MANCVTCGEELHPERAEKYDYCTRLNCRERNARGLQIVAVGVNKAADQYVVLNERTKQVHTPGPTGVPFGCSSAAPRPRWSEAQRNLALIYRSMGMKPDEIARKLGVSPYLVTQILLAATNQGKR